MGAPEPVEQRWRTASRSGGENCVEVSFGTARAGVRDSKNPGGPVVVTTPAAFSTFVDALRAGGLERA
ncbi:DUF397 domain-containing protein [Actinophytocola xanthii]|uniref:DUF397 domain-containing protein n=1 Tax=Actinophytocola xanthii TaxID=1912961 RepID=A0A1Q8CRH1_9PSEU|nr:DUF397 domain-containing protein [Actinophytocola xanthii]OLF16959.1 hypothetical protein BU204_13915 [Actinophytocola xanthii]